MEAVALPDGRVHLYLSRKPDRGGIGPVVDTQGEGLPVLRLAGRVYGFRAQNPERPGGNAACIQHTGPSAPGC